MSKVKLSWWIIAVTLTLTVLGASCTTAPAGSPSSSAPASSSKPAAGAITLKTAIFYPETDAFAQGFKDWMKAVSDKTQGRVQVTPYWAGSLVSSADSLDALKEGSVDVANVVAAAQSGKMPDLSIWEPVGSYPTGDKYVGMLDKTRPLMKSIFDAQQIVFLWQQPSPGVVVVAKGKHVKTPSDYKGLKLRAAGRWQSLQLQTLGASPVAVDPGEQYMAIQTGTVDGALSVNNLVMSFKLDEVAPYITELNMPVNLTTYAMSKGMWDKISADDKKAIEEASIAAERGSMPELQGFQEKNIKSLQDKGAKVYFLSPEEQSAFVKAADPVWAEIKNVSGPLGKQLVDTLAQFR